MTVFVAGVHGVGKTYLCEEFSRSTGISHRSASALIKAEMAGANWGADKLTSGIDQNQKALTAAVAKCLIESSELLLDGHFVLKNNQGHFIRLDAEIFSHLSITAVVLVENSPETISTRLSVRDGSTNFGDIADFMQAELEQAELVCRLISCPLIRLSAPSTEEFKQTVASFFPGRF